MRKKVTIPLIMLLVATLFLPGCLGGSDPAPAPPPATIPQLQSEINTLKTNDKTQSDLITNLSNQIAGMPGTNPNTTALMERISALETQVSELAELEGNGSSSGTGSESELAETTRWRVDGWLDYGSGYNWASMEVEPRSRIEDEDDYTIYLLLYNLHINPYFTEQTKPRTQVEDCLYLEDGMMWKSRVTLDTGNWTSPTSTPSNWKAAAMNDIYNPVPINEIALFFRPKSGDRVKVDADKVYLDNYGSPVLDWETEVSERSDGTCRKIEAKTGAKFTLPVPNDYRSENPECPIPYELRLEFELYYAVS